jgi:outer membrane PBP1 activator LpoA protein
MAPVVAGTAVTNDATMSVTTAGAPANTPVIATSAVAANTPPAAVTSNQVAVLLPTSGQLTDVSSAIRAGFSDAYQQNTASNKPTIVIDNTDGKAITSVYAGAVQKGATAVVGPLEKSDVQALANQGVCTFTLALNQVPTLTPPTNFYQFALAPQDEAYALADKAWYQGYSQPVIIAPDTSWGQAAVTAFTEQWRRDGGKNSANITYHLPGDPTTIVKSNVGSGTANSKADVVILIANPPQAYQIMPVLHAKANNIPVYATSIIYSGTPNAAANQMLNGIQFVDMPILIGNNPALASATTSLKQWQQTHPNGLVRLYAYGYDAYQLSTLQNQLSRASFSYQGATGTLYVDNQQQIRRKLAWGTFANGLVVPAS